MSAKRKPTEDTEPEPVKTPEGTEQVDTSNEYIIPEYGVSMEEISRRSRITPL